MAITPEHRDEHDGLADRKHCLQTGRLIRRAMFMVALLLPEVNPLPLPGRMHGISPLQHNIEGTAMHRNVLCFVGPSSGHFSRPVAYLHRTAGEDPLLACTCPQQHAKGQSTRVHLSAVIGLGLNRCGHHSTDILPLQASFPTVAVTLGPSPSGSVATLRAETLLPPSVGRPGNLDRTGLRCIC